MNTSAKIIVISIAVLLVIQLIPYGHRQLNPPVIREPRWNSPETRNLARRACFDCHSHETTWPWYARFAPVSWLVAYDIQAGRSELNFSDWQGGKRKAEAISELVKEVSEGEMPPFQYRIVHPSARLSEREKQQLIEGFRAIK